MPMLTQFLPLFAVLALAPAFWNVEHGIHAAASDSSAIRNPQSAFAQAACQTFRETGKTVCGKFLDYWKSHGGLAQQGYPISNEFKEVSEVNGKTYTVQY